MKEISIIGVDLAKNVFQLHGAAADGSVLFRKKLSRPQFQRFMAEQPQCLVVMEACGGAHHWARELVRVGHEVKLIAPRYVKPFIKRQKNDAADAKAIVEAALRPTMYYPAGDACIAERALCRAEDRGTKIAVHSVPHP